MPIVTHEDEKILAQLEVDVAKHMKEMSLKEKSISDQEIKVANMYADYCRFLGSYTRKLRDLSKQLEILSREERSGINSEDVDHNKARIARIEEKNSVYEQYYDKLKDLAIQKRSLLKKRIEYSQIIVEIAGLRKKIVDAGLKIEQQKNKMVPAEKIAVLETKLKDIEREFERRKKDLQKKEDQLEKERDEVNDMWKALKASIENEME